MAHVMLSMFVLLGMWKSFELITDFIIWWNSYDEKIR